MASFDEYFHYQKKYEKKYGEKTIVLEQMGGFFEIYGCPENNMKRMDEVAELLNWSKAIKDQKRSMWMAGCPLVALWKFVKNPHPFSLCFNIL